MPVVVVAARFRSQRMNGKRTRHGFSGDYQFGDVLEVAARFFFGPKGAAGRQLHQILGSAKTTSVAKHTPGMSNPPLHEDGLDARFEELVIKSGFGRGSLWFGRLCPGKRCRRIQSSPCRDRKNEKCNFSGTDFSHDLTDASKTPDLT